MAPKFYLGEIVGTPGAIAALNKAGQDPQFFLHRHIQGDWGEVPPEDKQANDRDLLFGGRLLSAYKTLLGEKILVITEGSEDSRVTTILLSSDY